MATDQNNPSGPEQDNYHFIREEIRIPEKKHSRIRKIITAILSAVGVGTIAAFTFAAVYPTARKADGPGNGEVVVAAESASSSASSVQENGSSENVQTDSSSESTSAEQNRAGDGDNTEQEAGQNAGAEEEDSLAVLQNVIEQGEKSIVQVIGITDQQDYFNQSYENRKQASGLLFADSDTEYFILTEKRTVEEVGNIRVRISDGTETDAQLVKSDANTGLAVVKIEKSDLSEEAREGFRPAELGSSSVITRGEDIIVLGSPMGFEDTVVTGHITSTDNERIFFDSKYNILTTDVQGNESGSGVVLNTEGRVIGIISQSLGSGESNMVTAYRCSQIAPLVQDMLNGETNPYMGIRGADVSSSISSKTGIPAGMIVEDVADGSPAMVSGIKKLDVVIQINDRKIVDVNSYLNVLKGLDSEENAKVKVARRGANGYEELEFDVEVGAV